MRRGLKSYRHIFAVLTASLSIVVFSAFALAASHTDAPEVKSAYLSEYFGIVADGSVTIGDYAEFLLKLQPESGVAAIDADDAGSILRALDAIKYAVVGANMEELALVFSKERVSDALASAGVVGVPEGYAPYVACALRVGLIDSAALSDIALNPPSDAASVVSLLMGVADINGVSRNYLGYTDDPGIISEFVNRWNSFTLFDDERLSSIGAELVTRNVTTGYNLKSSRNAARFLPGLTLTYGHDDIKHAMQILALLRSERITARVQFEPKVSIYQYMPEWGEPGEPTPTYEVRRIRDDLMLVYATEYDLVLEFANRSDMDALDRLVMSYAKKNSGEEGRRLLHGAWWQPLYYSRFDMGAGYEKIYDNVARNGVYSLHPFCLEENRSKVLTAYMAADPNVKVEQVPIWCNRPFYRYLLGESE
jgi:hypothetical protein